MIPCLFGSASFPHIMDLHSHFSIDIASVFGKLKRSARRSELWPALSHEPSRFLGINPPVNRHFDPPSHQTDMGLLSILKKVKEKEKEVRLLILGLDNAGKTTILRKFSGEPIDKIEPTLGFNIKTLEHGGYRLNFWDVGGQRTIRAYWRNYFERTDGLIWVVDSSDRRRLELCRDELHDLLSQEKLAGASLLILANKQDLAGAAPADEIAKVIGLEKSDKFTKRHWSIHGCSAVAGSGLADGMDWMISDIANRIFMLS